MSKNIHIALKIAEQQIAHLMKYCDRHQAVLLVASSMGQEAIDWGDYKSELRIEDNEKFVRGIGFKGVYRANMAMQPDFPFAFPSINERDEFLRLADQIVDLSGNKMFTSKVSSNTVNLNLCLSLRTADEGGVLIRHGQRKSFKDIGLAIIQRDHGTAYHTPTGTAVFYGSSVKQNTQRGTIESIQLAPTVLDYLGIPRPSYMGSSIAQNVFR